MSDALEKGMVLSMNLWGSGYESMEWLDGKTGCQGGCNVDTDSVSFSNFQLTREPFAKRLLNFI